MDDWNESHWRRKLEFMESWMWWLMFAVPAVTLLAAFVSHWSSGRADWAANSLLVAWIAAAGFCLGVLLLFEAMHRIARLIRRYGGAL